MPHQNAFGTEPRTVNGGGKVRQVGGLIAGLRLS